MAARVFIDGEAGTTGLQIRQRLGDRDDIELLQIDPGLRKDDGARKKLLDAADVAILCLPDEAARRAVALVSDPGTKILDASTAHRVAEGWVYGFPERAPAQREALARAARVANPGCYPTGFIGLVAPLLDCGLLPAHLALSVHAVSGYSGGGRGLIERYEGGHPADVPPARSFGLYGTQLAHKHLPEMQALTGLDHAPLFTPSVSRFRCGMLVQVPLPSTALGLDLDAARVREAWSRHYEDGGFVEVMPVQDQDALQLGFLDPEALNGSNRMQLFVYENELRTQQLLVARLDNLGKGASGAAVQNLNLMLGLPEHQGLRGQPSP